MYCWFSGDISTVVWGGGTVGRYRVLTSSVLGGIFVAIFWILPWHLGGYEMPRRILFR